MAKQKQKCELCGAVFGLIHDKCPKCGCPEIYELDEEEGEVDMFDFFDSPCSPCDTIGGI